MRMIGKLGKDKKADLPGHLAEVVHAYSATCSAVTGYNLHYLMFGWRPRLPVDFYFPTFRSTEVPMREASAKHVDECIATVQDWLRTALWEAQTQSMAGAQRQKRYYDQKVGNMNLKPGDMVLVKADVYKGKRKIRDRWEEETCKVVHQIMTDVPPYNVMDQCGWSDILHQNWLLVTWEVGIPMYIVVCYAWDSCTSPTPCKPTSRKSESESTAQEDSGLVVAQCQASKTSLAWINRKLQLLPWMSTGGSTEDGWRLEVMWSRHDSQMEACVWPRDSMSLPIDAIG